MGAAGVDHGGQYWIAENEDGRWRFTAPKAACVGGASCVEAAVGPGAESLRARALPVSTGHISLGVVAGHHRRTTDPVQLSRSLGLDPTVEVSEMRLPNNTMLAVAELQSGGYAVLLRNEPDGHVTVAALPPATASSASRS